MKHNMPIGKTFLFIFITLLFQATKTYAERNYFYTNDVPPNKKIEILNNDNNIGLLPLLGKKMLLHKLKSQQQINKGTALLILLLTGPLGGHRVYLGTSVYVPLVYTFTIGGGFGLLPIIDAFAIIFTNDLSKYINNDKIIMWTEN